MDWQYAVTAGLVAVSAGYLAWRGWRTSRASCGGGCGCAKSKAPPVTGPAVTFIPADRLTVRPRKPD